MSARLVERCGLCGNEALVPVLSLGSSPPTCVMVPVDEPQATEEHHPLELLQCSECTLVQLSVIVDPEVVFPQNYPYSSGNSKALHENFAELAAQVEVSKDDLVVDIGANDGTLLSKFKCKKVAVEPTNQAGRIEGAAGVYQDFFTEELAERILAEHGPAQAVTACNVLAHVEDPGEVMRGIALLLDEDGVLIAENHDLASVVDGGQWDTIYHEHLRFYSPYSFNLLLERYGLGARKWKEIPTHGGSFRMLAGKGLQQHAPPLRDYDFKGLSASVAAARNAIRREAIALGPFCGIGATARATTLINVCGLEVEDVGCVCEVPGSDKIGHFIPGTRIPVIDESRLYEQPACDALLFSWHLADGIVPKLRARGYKGKVMVPLPTVRYV